MHWESKPIEIYYRNNVDYYMFVDESGEHHIKNFDKNNPFFTVAAVIIKKDNYNYIKQEINDLKNKYWENGCFKYKNKYIKKVCLVSRSIRRRQEAFSKYYLSDSLYENFMNDISSAMGILPYFIISAVIDKNKLLANYNKPIDPYSLAMTFILERFVKFLHSKKSEGMVIMESRGKKEDSVLHQLFLEIHNNGTDYISSMVFRNTITGGYYFNKKWNIKENNLDTFVGLEIADLVAHPIGYFVKNNEKTRPFNIFENKFLGYKNYIGKGLKVFP